MGSYQIGLIVSLLLLSCSVADYRFCTLQQPPDAFYYPHSIPEYDGATPTFPEEYLLKMKSTLDDFVNIMLEHAPPGWEYPMMGDQGPQIFYGSGGRALLFLDLYLNMAEIDDDLSQKSLDLAKQYIDQAISTIGWYSQYIGFLKGHTGIYSVGAAIYHYLGLEDQAQEYIQVVRDAFTKVDVSSPMSYDEGVAGLLYCAEFLENHFGSPAIDRPLIINAAESMIEQGILYSFENGTLQWPNDDFQGAYWLGQGMGSSGILHRLFKIPEVLQDPDYRFYLEQTVLYWQGRQDSTGQVYDFITDNPDFATMPYKIQWCHGAPGFISEFATANTIFDKEVYLDSAKLAADITIRQGLLTKGLQLGHGTLGNLYMILTLYQQTLDEKYLYYFYELHKVALDTSELTDINEMKAYDCYPYSMFISSIGSGISAYGDFLSHFGKEDGILQMNMAAWEGPDLEQMPTFF